MYNVERRKGLKLSQSERKSRTALLTVTSRHVTEIYSPDKVGRNVQVDAQTYPTSDRDSRPSAENAQGKIREEEEGG